MKRLLPTKPKRLTSSKVGKKKAKKEEAQLPSTVVTGLPTIPESSNQKNSDSSITQPKQDANSGEPISVNNF
jgi:hypothetical protein